MTAERHRPAAVLRALTPEAKAALGAAEIELVRVPFRVGRESRGARAGAVRIPIERRRSTALPNNDLYLIEPAEPFNVSREHLAIDYDGEQFVLVDRHSTCGTIVEGRIVGGDNAGGAMPLADGDVIIAGTSSSRYIFKFRLG